MVDTGLCFVTWVEAGSLSLEFVAFCLSWKEKTASGQVRRLDSLTLFCFKLVFVLVSKCFNGFRFVLDFKLQAAARELM